MPTVATPESEAELPELVRLMFTSVKSVLVVGLAMALVAAVIWWTGGDPVAGAFLAAALISLSIRVAVTLAYQRADRGEAVWQAGDAKRWERRYAFAGSCFSSSLGLFGAYAILGLDAVSLASF